MAAVKKGGQRQEIYWRYLQIQVVEKRNKKGSAKTETHSWGCILCRWWLLLLFLYEYAAEVFFNATSTVWD